jgi:hypothetical protein
LHHDNTALATGKCAAGRRGVNVGRIGRAAALSDAMVLKIGDLVLRRTIDLNQGRSHGAQYRVMRRSSKNCGKTGE